MDGDNNDDVKFGGAFHLQWIETAAKNNVRPMCCVQLEKKNTCLTTNTTTLPLTKG